jgi:hypothetical protein
MSVTPDPVLLPEFYKGYVKRVEHLDMMEALVQGGESMVRLVRSIPEDHGNFRYAPDKWSVKELLCHVMDAERIFAYRALRFARHDNTPLPGFEENDYAPRANAEARILRQLAEEMMRLRATTLDLFASFSPEMLEQSGFANNYRISVKNLGFVIAGHESHHRQVLVDRYDLPA